MMVRAHENPVSSPAEAQVVCVTSLVGSVFICGLESQRIANLRTLLPSSSGSVGVSGIGSQGQEPLYKEEERGLAGFGIFGYFL